MTTPSEIRPNSTIAPVLINNTEIEAVELQNQRVISLSMMDKIHERPGGTARRTFNSYRDKLVENEDYFHVTRKNPMNVLRPLEIPPKGMIFLAESGYLLVVKTFTDDLAWQVQRQLVRSYFKTKTEPAKLLLPETLIPSEQHELFEAVKTKSAMFRDIGKVRAEIYSRIHNKFKIAKYDQLPRTQLHDALNYVEQMEVKSSKQIEQQAPAESLEVGLLKIRVEALEMKNHNLKQHNDCMKMEVDSLRFIVETSRGMTKEVWAMMRELTGGFVLKARIA